MTQLLLVSMLRKIVLVITLLVGNVAWNCDDAIGEPYGVAVLQGLDKVTARTSTFDAPIGKFVEFGTLKIVARICYKKPPEETPESAVFIDISEVRPGEPAEPRYRGWMFASSPAIAAMEHPVYDVWVLDCRMRLSSFSGPLPQELE